MALLPDLGHFKFHFLTQGKNGADGQGLQGDPLRDYVFRKIPIGEGQALGPHLINAFCPKEADLTMPVPPMGISLDAEIHKALPLGNLLLLLPFPGADAYC